MRNQQMARISQVLVLFWDGESSRSQDILNTALEYELNCYVINYKTKKFYSDQRILDEFYPCNDRSKRLLYR